MSEIMTRLATALGDRYRIERELGAGGMATVYLAHDLKHDRDVAIKVLHPDLGAALGGERFLSEIRTTARLQHPHILPLLDSGEADSLLYYVMPLVTGETLRARLTRERQLPIADAVLIAREVADALGYAHGLGVIHRDIKPENILLQGGHALVADFGIALAVQSAGGQRMTQTGLSLGTPQYMSPEQAMGERTIDARSDIYALGAVTYEMLVGEAPFTGPSVQAIVARVLTEEPRSIGAQRKAVPERVEGAVLRALEKLPADRFATAAEFVLALEQGAGPERRSPVASRGGAERSRALIAAAVTLMTLAGAGGWLLGRRASAASTPAVWSTSVVLPDSIALDPMFGNSEGVVTLALSPDGTQLVFVAGSGARRSQLFLRRLSDFAARAIEGTEGATAPFFSPAGDAVAFVAGAELKRVSLVDGRVSVIAPGVRETWGAAWASDGRIILAEARGTRLTVFAPTGERLAQHPCGACTYPELLPGEQRVLVSDRSGLRILELGTGMSSAVPRFGASSPADRLRGSMGRLDGDGHLVAVGAGGQLQATPFDAERGVVTGSTRAIAEGVRVESGRGAAQVAVARNGVIVFAPGGVMSLGILVRADRAGKLDTILAPPASYNAIELSPDGRRLVVRVGMPTGDQALQVIDVESGRVTPWITAPTIGWPYWTRDGGRVSFVRDSQLLMADPDAGSPPRVVPLRRILGGLRHMADSTRFGGQSGDTLLVVDSTGRALVSHVSGPIGTLAITGDDRWFAAEESPGAERNIVAWALDGSGRRLVLSSGRPMGMVEWVAGGHELVMAEDRGQVREAPERERERFFSIAYDPTRVGQPFGEPTPLFTATIANFPGRCYAVGMGGNRFVFKQHLPSAPLREIRVMRDWHARLATGGAP